MPVVRELKTEEVLLRFQKQESRPLTSSSLPRNCLDSMTIYKHSKFDGTLGKKVMGLGILELLEAWPTI